MLIGWEENNYFINCTAVQLMIKWFSHNKQNGGKVFWTQAWNGIALEELDQNTNKRTKILL
jgi:hypothetical protein